MENQDLRSYLPSKRVGIIAAVIVVGFAAYGVSQNYSAISNQFQSNELSEEEVKKELEQTDSDNDGLSDWQENLWGTNPNDPDTDGDGTQDGKEVANQRDPTKASNDKLSAVTRPINKPTTSDAENQETNKTSQVVDKILPETAILADSEIRGQTISTDDLKNLTKEARSALNNYKNSYNESDLKVSNQASLGQYSRTVREIIRKYQNRSPLGREISIMSAAIPNENQALFEKLRDFSIIYEALADELVNVPVPPSVVSDHLNMVNNYKKIAKTIRDMAKYQDDPVRALQAISTYRNLSNTQDQLTQFLYN